MVKATVNSEFVNILLDTGAGVCLIDLGTLEQLVKLPCFNEPKTTLLDASGQVMDIVGEITLRG